MRKILFVLFSGITFTGVAVVKKDAEHSTIIKPDGSSVLLLTSLIKKENGKKEQPQNDLQQEEGKLSFGFHGGPAGAIWHNTSELKRETGVHVFPIFAFVGGFSFQYSLNPKVKLCIETNYERKGARTMFYNTIYQTASGQTGFGDAAINNYLDYIVIPLMVKYVVGKKRFYRFLPEVFI